MNQREKQFTDNLIEAVNNALAKRDARIDSLMEQLSLYQQLLQKQENDIAALLLLLEEQASASLNRLEQWFDAEKNSFEQSLHAFLIQQVKAIPMPKDGRDGKDAFNIDILPDIDETKSYARGTLATHHGGLWRAYEQTKGMHGWECIVRGCSSLAWSLQDERTLLVNSILSNGEMVQTKYVFPTMIYQGVFAINRALPYQKGDVVTWGGSLWHCNEPTKDKPGELHSKGWTLIVKRGRDGRDTK
ncbi:phage portal protein [Proteus mirabilis]|nr:phage portal protein [Proteus mirabilis]